MIFQNKFKFRTSISTLALMAAGAVPALADVTPEEVWQNWQDASAAMGQTVVAASVARNGAALEITDAVFAKADQGITVEASLGSITMTDQGDGTVLVTMSPDMPMTMRVPALQAGQPEVDSKFTFGLAGMTMLAKGTAADLTYEVNAPTLAVKMEQASGPAGQAANLTVDATMSNMTGTYGTQTVDGKLTVSSDIAVQGIAAAVVGTDPAKGSEMRLTAAVEGAVSKTSGLVLGAMASLAQSPAAFAELNSTSDMTTEATSFDLEVVDPTGLTKVKGTMGAGTISARFEGGLMDYSGAQNALSMTITAPSIPLPDVTVTLDAVNFGVKLPLVPSDVAMPFAFSTSLTNLALSDQLWAMFDPTSALPHDPVNLVIDTEGMAKPNAMPADAAAMAQGLPADLESLNIKQLRLSVAGAELLGAGTSTFEAVPGGLPNPTAKLDFTLTGANALMDKLVAAGFLTPDMLTFPRMTLAMVAKPAADGSDKYESVIEFKDKAILANGQKLHQME